jgi:hypothetical protein
MVEDNEQCIAILKITMIANAEGEEKIDVYRQKKAPN